MIAKIEGKKIIIEFPLTVARRSWKIRRNSQKKNLKYGLIIRRGDVFEWMITNEEIRDILDLLKSIDKKMYENIREIVLSNKEYYVLQEKKPLRHPLKEAPNIIIEISLQPKQRKRSERTPYLFILMPLDRCSKTCCIINKKGEEIKEPVGYKIKAGDRLRWIIERMEWIKDIVTHLTRLSRDHHNRLREEVFKEINHA